jgi:glycosyltransferase involved in cell wall biosynthesis
MKILIATGIYPPEIGGPAEYARNLSSEWTKTGHEVSVAVFSKWNFLPTGVRHLAYFFAMLPKVARSDAIFILDTFSAALPATLAGLLFGKKTILRTGGDFLWESYVERTGDLVLLSDFYKTSFNKLNGKEKLAFKCIRFVLRNVSVLVFSTKWQQDIFWYPYDLQRRESVIIENYYGPKITGLVSDSRPGKQFLASTRNLRWKNIGVLEEIFNSPDVRESASLFTKPVPRGEFIAEMNASYAVILASLGDISPNMILDAIRLNKPFILTEETGIADRVKGIALLVDPKNPEDIKKKVLWLLDERNYSEQKRKIENFAFTHGWEEMAQEYVDLFKSIEI